MSNFYHLAIKNTSLGKGESCIARIAYRANTKITDMKTGKVYDFTQKSDLIFSQILMPKKMSEKFKNKKDREEIWNTIQSWEKRGNARTAREFEIALPNEFSILQNAELTKDIATFLIQEYDFLADINIHNPKKGKRKFGAKNNNIHAHIYCSTRNSNGEKTRALDCKKKGPEEFKKIRKKIEELINAHYKKNGYTKKVSCKSLKAEEEELKEWISLAKEIHEIDKKQFNKEARNYEKTQRASREIRATKREIRATKRANKAERETIKTEHDKAKKKNQEQQFSDRGNNARTVFTFKP